MEWAVTKSFLRHSRLLLLELFGTTLGHTDLWKYFFFNFGEFNVDFQFRIKISARKF